MKLKRQIILNLVLTVFLGSGLLSSSATALGSQQNPQSGSLGLEATIPTSPPATAPTIAVPAGGSSFSSIPIAVGGLCTSGLLVKVFDNNVFVGSAECTSGGYSLKADLFGGGDTLYAQDYDALGQGSPSSASVNVSYSSSQYSNPGALVVVTSGYGELGANPGQKLVWPITLGGGTPPYALDTDWGDGTPPTLQSAADSGQIDISHTYDAAGIYEVTVSVSDNKGSTGFLQLVAIANGQIAASSKNGNSGTSGTPPASAASYWWVLLIMAAALLPAFWLGSRHGRTVLRRNL